MLKRVGVETEAAPAGVRINVAAEPKPLVVDPGTEDVMVAVVPTWRRDLVIEADVAEEVARIRGYEQTPAHLPDTLMPAYRPSPVAVRDGIRATMAGAGLSEVITHALVSPPDEAKLRWPDDDGLDLAQPAAGCRSRSRTRFRASIRSCAGTWRAACSTCSLSTNGKVERTSPSTRSAKATVEWGSLRGSGPGWPCC